MKGLTFVYYLGHRELLSVFVNLFLTQILLPLHTFLCKLLTFGDILNFHTTYMRSHYNWGMTF